MKKVVSLLLMLILISMTANSMAELGVQILDDQPESTGMGVQIIDGSGNSVSNGAGELQLNNKIKQSGDYAIEFQFAKTHTDDKLADGYWLSYLTTRESGEQVTWLDYHVGTHTDLSIQFSFTNMTKDETDVLKRVEGWLEFDNKYVFNDFKKAQYNPNQLDSNGNPKPSIDAVPLEPLVSADLCFFTAIPKIVRDSNKPLVFHLMIDNDEYTVNIRDNLTTW